jgi:hypothetical protein
MKRTIIDVFWNRKFQGWTVKRRGSDVAIGKHTKAEAVSRGRDWARSVPPSQLVVRNKDGRIAFEHTYGLDPAKYKG